MTWRRHVNQLKKCFDATPVSQAEQQLADTSPISEEDSSTSGITEGWSNSNSSEVVEHYSPNVAAPSTTSNDIRT